MRRRSVASAALPLKVRLHAFYGRAAVIEPQDGLIIEAEAGDGVGAVLAHADAVAVAAYVEAEDTVCVPQRKARGVEPEQLPQPRTGVGLSADRAGVHAAARRVGRAAEPPGRVAVRGQPERFGKFGRGAGDGARIRGRVLLAGAVHRLQIGHVRAPDRGRRLRRAAGAGKIHRVDERAAVGQHLVLRLLYSVRCLVPRRVKRRAIPLLQRVRAETGLTAGALAADVRVRVLAARHLPPRKRARGDGLRLQRLRRKVRRHLREHDLRQIRLKVLFLRITIPQDRDRLLCAWRFHDQKKRLLRGSLPAGASRGDQQHCAKSQYPRPDQYRHVRTFLSGKSMRPGFPVCAADRFT